MPVVYRVLVSREFFSVHHSHIGPTPDPSSRYSESHTLRPACGSRRETGDRAGFPFLRRFPATTVPESCPRFGHENGVLASGLLVLRIVSALQFGGTWGPSLQELLPQSLQRKLLLSPIRICSALCLSCISELDQAL